MINKDQFELAFRHYCEDGGHSYDPWDIAVRWDDYQINPEKFRYLFPDKD
jgi:hypothetical protein